MTLLRQSLFRPLRLGLVLLTVVLVGILLYFNGVGSQAQAVANTQLIWYGQSAFKLTTPSGKVLLIDPWLTNPLNPNGKTDLAALDRADLILISHGHFDHVGDAAAIAKKTNAKLVSTADLGTALVVFQ